MVSPGAVKNVTSTSDPSMPRQWNVSCGKRLNLLQWMDEQAKYSIPLFFISCGITHEKPNVSGIHSTLESNPNSRRIKRLPNNTCRTRDSAPARLVSLSTHQPPVGSH